MLGRGRARQTNGRWSDPGRGWSSTPDSRQKSLFTKFMKDPEVEMADKRQAKRFLEGMETFESKANLVDQLMDSRKHGRRRIQEVLSFIECVRDVEEILVPFLRVAINDEMARVMYRELRGRFLHAIALTPGLMEFLAAGSAAAVSKMSATNICSFLLYVAKAFGEIRVSESVATVANMLKDRGDVDDAHTLCAVLLVDETQFGDTPDRQLSRLTRSHAACWVTDVVPPGGRHDNDHRNYRDIAIVPTAAELRCNEKPYLPLASGENAVINDPISRLLDSTFRLLREDALNTMRESIKERSRRWFNARVIDIDLKGRGSVSFILQCDTPSGGIPDWKRTRALAHGTVIALFDEKGTLQRTGVVSIYRDDPSWLNNESGPKFGVAFESIQDSTAALEELAINNISNDRYCDLRKRLKHENGVANDLVRWLRRMRTYELIEVSTSFFAYQPVLRALQTMETLPFAEELVHLKSPPDPRPNYLQQLIRFPNGRTGEHGYQCNLLQVNPAEDIEQNTSLDLSQAEAVCHALTNRVALIQGPPGTGKTFIGSLLARIIRENTDESILCVCYTNHALDQFLEHLVEHGERSIVRLGGRTKSEEVSRFQLRDLARSKMQPDESATRRFKQIDAQMHRCREVIEREIEMSREPVGWESPNGGVKSLLMNNYPHIYDFVSVPFLQDFKLVGPKRKTVAEDFLWTTWAKGKAFPVFMLEYKELSEEFEKFWEQPLSEREAFIYDLHRQIREIDGYSLQEAISDLSELARDKACVQQEQDLRILRQAKIIGATTSGAARYREMLSTVAPGVVIVEEAGEVLEAHVLASLSNRFTNESKHLILIGDHKQLRPKVETHSMTAVAGHGYNLDCSLFERLVLADLSSVTLQVQHRMRPSISRLIRSQTYPALVDHQSVFRYPDVKGVSESVVFIDHDNREDSDELDSEHPSKTKSNRFEVELCIEIVRFLRLQGYKSEQIVVLTPYLGQLLQLIRGIKSRLRDLETYIGEKDLDDLDEIVSTGEDIIPLSSQNNSLRCSSIDNYQGEESDIVIVSLVRSNQRGSIGFLKEPQRVNVLLSRARYGMFLIGNAATLTHSPEGQRTWEPILDMLRDADQVRRGLPTMCHPIDRKHTQAQKQCCEPCMRVPPECTEFHRCSQLCKDECGPCRVIVGPRTLSCGHVVSQISCHEVRTAEALQVASLKCKERVIFDFTTCGHRAETSCGNSQSGNPNCPELCKRVMDCGHSCLNRCGSCNPRHNCKQQCGRDLYCSHVCGKQCHIPGPCMPCKRPCENRCSHSTCPKDCNEPCAPCVEKCEWSCSHNESLKCSLVCSAPCIRVPCNRRCEKKLDCGHTCPSLCGEDCPKVKYCVECGDANVRSAVVDLIMSTTYEDHDLDRDPVVFLPCRHFFAISTMDGLIGLQQAYRREGPEGDFIEPTPLIESDIQAKARQCPQCRASIHSVRRYGRITKFAELRTLERKHMAMANESIMALSKNEKRTIGSLKKLKETIRKSPMRRVLEACDGDKTVGEFVLSPPALPLIGCLALLGNTYATKVQKAGDVHFQDACKSFQEAIELANTTQSLRCGAVIRLDFARFLSPWSGPHPEYRQTALEHIEWILSEASKPAIAEFIEEATKLKERMGGMQPEVVREIIAAMRGNQYGASAHDHWYECPNGHPYFIGECGGAMQTGTCIECGAPVGGSSHQLLTSNRRAQGLVSEALSQES